MTGIQTTNAPNDPNQIWFIIIAVALFIQFIWSLSGVIFIIAVLTNWFENLRKAAKLFFTGIYTAAAEKLFNRYIAFTGFLYDRAQDIFYSSVNAWQRVYGYCRLYDEASILSGMIIDCEPVEFTYNGKRWLIEFWKGQYDLTTGFEIGIYNTAKNDLDIPDIFQGTFYGSIEDDEMLRMSCTLYKNGKVLFKREDKHWWLTGFKIGEFSSPSELEMLVSIEFNAAEMRDAFVAALGGLHYTRYEIFIRDNTVSFMYGKPRSVQPYARTKEIESITQWKNKFFCDMYNDLAKGLKTSLQKLRIIRKNKTELGQKVKELGKSHRTNNIYKTLKPYLG